MDYLAIKRAIKRQHQLDIAYQDATLKYIRACKEAGIWDDTKALQVMIEQTRMQKLRIF